MRFGITFLLIIIFSFSCIAQKSVFTAIDEAYNTSDITFDEAMLYKVYAVFAPEMLPQQFQGLPIPVCPTPTIASVYSNLDKLSEEVRAEIMGIMARPWLPLTYSTTHFVFHYTLTGPDAVSGLSYVMQMASAFEDAYNFITVTKGYITPPSDGTAGGDSRYDVYIVSLPPNILGYTVPEAAGPAPWNDATSYIKMRNSYSGFSSPLDYMRITAVHEFFHAVQFAYDYSEQPWYMEVSSVWISDVRYPAVDIEHMFLDTIFRNPQMSIMTYDGAHEYGSYIWNTYLSLNYGDTVVRVIWERNRFATCISSFQTVLARYGTSRSSAFADFFVQNYFTGTRDIYHFYPEGDTYPLVRLETVHTTYPASGGTSHPPANFGANYVKFEIPTGETRDFNLTFDGDDDVNWVVSVVVPKAGAALVRNITLDEHAYGNITIPHADYSSVGEIIMVVSNVSTSPDTGEYTYFADFVTTSSTYPPPENLRVEFTSPDSICLGWEPPPGVGPVEIAYDDSSGEVFWPRSVPPYGTVEHEAVRFSVSRACSLIALKVFARNDGSSGRFHVWGDSAGLPRLGTELCPAISDIPANVSWTTISIPGGAYVPAGDFHIGLERATDMPAIMVDTTGAVAGRSNIRISGVWYSVPANFMIRALVKAGARFYILYPVESEAFSFYKVYRSKTPGGPYTLLDSVTTNEFTDTTVLADSMYYYVVTAIYDSIHESDYSNEVVAVAESVPPVEVETLSHDDGDPAMYYGANYNDRFAVVFSPRASCQILTLEYRAQNMGSGPGYFGIELYSFSHGHFGRDLMPPLSYPTAPDADGWTRVDISSFEVYCSSDFAVSFVIMDTAVYLGADSLNDGNSWTYISRWGNWYIADARYFIRAVVRYLGGTETYTITGTAYLGAGTGGAPLPTDLSGTMIRILETDDVDTTDSLGNYEFTGISPGVYTLEAFHPGYERQHAEVVLVDDNAVQDFSLVPLFTPLNPPQNLLAKNFQPSRISLNWAPPRGQDGTSGRLMFYNPLTTLWFYDTIQNPGDLYTTRYEIMFPCSLRKIGVSFYDRDSVYEDVSIHLWLDDGNGYPSLDWELMDSVVVTPVPYTTTIQWTVVDVSTLGVALLPGQAVHLGVRVLGHHSSVLSNDTIPDGDPPRCWEYNAVLGTWNPSGEHLMYMDVAYFTHITGFPGNPTRFESYIVMRADSSDSFTEVARLDSTAFVDTTVSDSAIYKYFVYASYEHGFSTTTDTVKAMALSRNDSAWVLLVDDDMSSHSAVCPDEGAEIANLLFELGVPLNGVDLDSGEFVPMDTLSRYRAVIWNCGIAYSRDWTLSDSEEANIARYLDAGGKFLLFAQDYLWDRYRDSVAFHSGSFPHDYLGVSRVIQDVVTVSDTGGRFVGYGVASGLRYGVRNPFGRRWALYPDDIIGTLGDTLLVLDLDTVRFNVGITYRGGAFKSAFVTVSPLSLSERDSSTVTFLRRILYDYFAIDVVETVETLCMTYHILPGYNLISVPFAPFDSLVDSLFPANLGAYGYDGRATTFFAAETLLPGNGYFVLFSDSLDIDVCGYYIDSLKTRLYRGWNLFGVQWRDSLFWEIDSMEFIPAAVRPLEIWSYDPITGIYSRPDTLFVGKGYWILVRDSCILWFGR